MQKLISTFLWDISEYMKGVYVLKVKKNEIYIVNIDVIVFKIPFLFRRREGDKDLREASFDTI